MKLIERERAKRKKMNILFSLQYSRRSLVVLMSGLSRQEKGEQTEREREEFSPTTGF